MGEAIEAGKAGAAMLGDSPIAAQLTMLGGMANGLESYVLGLLADGGRLAGGIAAALAATLAFAFHLAVCRFIASFLVPLREYGRMLGPLIASDDPPPVSRPRLFLAAALATLTLFLIVPYLVFAIDAALRERPAIQAQLERIQIRIERIDDSFVHEGTIAEIELAKLKIASQRDAKVTLETALDAGFDAMIGNVDGYLDWYYSLPGEYARIGHMLVGDMEAYMSARLSEALGADDPFGAFEGALATANEADKQARAEFARTAEAIIARNRVEPGASNVVVVGSAERDMLIALGSSEAMISLSQRVAGGGVAAFVSGAVAAKVVSNALAKGTIKLGANALAKVVGSKATGSLAGAATGALAGGAIGSAVPIVGTAIGAVVGGITTGLLVGVGVEALLLQLEEQFSRDDFRADLVAAINVEREEARALLKGGPVAVSK